MYFFAASTNKLKIMGYYNKNVEKNHVVSGKVNQYESWEILPHELPAFDCKSFVFLISYVTLPKNYHFYSAEFYKIATDIQIQIKNKIIYSYIAIPVQDLVEAKAVIADLMIL